MTEITAIGKPIIVSEGDEFSNDQSFTTLNDDGTDARAVIVKSGDSTKFRFRC